MRAELPQSLSFIPACTSKVPLTGCQYTIVYSPKASGGRARASYAVRSALPSRFSTVELPPRRVSGARGGVEAGRRRNRLFIKDRFSACLLSSEIRRHCAFASPTFTGGSLEPSAGGQGNLRPPDWRFSLANAWWASPSLPVHQSRHDRVAERRMYRGEILWEGEERALVSASKSSAVRTSSHGLALQSIV
jgi:hypothetical protein